MERIDAYSAINKQIHYIITHGEQKASLWPNNEWNFHQGKHSALEDVSVNQQAIEIFLH